MIAVVVVRDGAVPLGADETVAECDGCVLIVGHGTAAAAEALSGFTTHVTLVEVASVGALALTTSLVPVLDEAAADIIVLPASADGRDLAPRLAAAMRLPLYANATLVTRSRVELLRAGGLRMQHVTPSPRFVATLVPGVRGAVPIDEQSSGFQRVTHHTGQSLTTSAGSEQPTVADARCVAVLPPEVATMDLAEAPRIIGGGAGLDHANRFEQLRRLGAVVDASVGATRVITDRHWIGHERQIGSTGVVVDPDLYIAFGISGAVQHTAGLGTPEHIISINTDPHCPMMHMADLAVVADANAVLDALLAQLASGSEHDRG